MMSEPERLGNVKLMHMPYRDRRISYEKAFHKMAVADTDYGSQKHPTANFHFFFLIFQDILLILFGVLCYRRDLCSLLHTRDKATF